MIPTSQTIKCWSVQPSPLLQGECWVVVLRFLVGGGKGVEPPQDYYREGVPWSPLLTPFSLTWQTREMTVGFVTLKAGSWVPTAASHLKRNNVVHWRETALNTPVLANVRVDSMPPDCFATQMRIFQSQSSHDSKYVCHELSLCTPCQSHKSQDDPTTWVIGGNVIDKKKSLNAEARRWIWRRYLKYICFLWDLIKIFN